MKSPMFSVFKIRAFFFTSILICAFVSPVTSEAQSVVGKWKRAGTKFFVKNATTGKQVAASAEIQQKYDQAEATRGYTEMLEMRADNTYTTTILTSGNTKPVTHTGKYSLSGKKLDMQIPVIDNQKTTITIRSITSSKMVWSLLFMDKLMEITYLKM